MAEEITTGATLTFMNDGDGISIDPTTGAVNIVSGAERSSIAIKVSFQPTEEAELQEFLVAITDLNAANSALTVFDDDTALGKMNFLGYLAPQWSLLTEGDRTFARLIPDSSSRAHGDWSNAKGDGLYRTLVRFDWRDQEYSLDRRFSFGARVVKAGNDWHGIRVDAYENSAGERKLHLREYTGQKGMTKGLATADVGWEHGEWMWFEVEVDGTSIKARLYPEAETAPDWQVTVTTTQVALSDLDPGAFGPGGFPALNESPVIDVCEISYEPLI